MEQNFASMEPARPDVQPLPGAQFVLRWAGDCGDGKRNGGRNNPEWLEIEARLRSLRGTVARVDLRILGEMLDIAQFGFKDKQGRLIKEAPGTRKELTVTGEDGYYWVLLSEEDGKLRMYTNPEPKGVRVEVYVDTYLGDEELTEDLDVVTRIFREFFQTGDVSRELMS